MKIRDSKHLIESKTQNASVNPLLIGRTKKSKIKGNKSREGAADQFAKVGAQMQYMVSMEQRLQAEMDNDDELGADAELQRHYTEFRQQQFKLK